MVNLDPKASYDTRRVIKDLAKKEGKTVFFTSNNAYEAESLADRIGILYKGKMAAEGTADELKRAFGTTETTMRMSFDAMPIGSDLLLQRLKESKGISHAALNGSTITLITEEPMVGLESAVRLLNSKNIRARNIEILPSSLESVFINVTRDRKNGA
jgi:ABC-2 type transport system ATP-binding protein